MDTARTAVLFPCGTSAQEVHSEQSNSQTRLDQQHTTETLGDDDNDLVLSCVSELHLQATEQQLTSRAASGNIWGLKTSLTCSLSPLKIPKQHSCEMPIHLIQYMWNKISHNLLPCSKITEFSMNRR